MANLFTVLSGCGQDLGWSAVERSIRSEFPAVPQLSTDSLAAWLQAPPPAQPLLLDVRTADEYAVSHLPDARRVEPGAEALPAFLDDLPRDTPIVAYCSVGYRSSALTDRLLAAGFTDVHNLEGSIFRWANEGRPVVRDGETVRQVHPYDRLWGRLLDREHRAPID